MLGAVANTDGWFPGQLALRATGGPHVRCAPDNGTFLSGPCVIELKPALAFIFPVKGYYIIMCMGI